MRASLPGTSVTLETNPVVVELRCETPRPGEGEELPGEPETTTSGGCAAAPSPTSGAVLFGLLAWFARRRR